MAVNPGDIAFVGVNSTDPDQFAILALKAIAPGDTFYVTDGGYISLTNVANTTFRATEGFLQYTAPAGGIAAGSVILINAGSGNSPSVSLNDGGAAGTVTLLANSSNNTTNFSFSTSGDSLTAYTVTSGTYLTGTPTLIAFIDFGVNPYGSGSAQASNIPTISGGQVLDLANLDNAIFTNASNVYSQTISALSTASNFTQQEAAPYDLTTLASAPITTIPSVTLSLSTTTGSEAEQTAITVSVTAASAVSGDQTVTLGVSGTNITTDDYALNNTAANTVTITIPNGQTTGTATFKIADDTQPEGTETATLSISNPSSGIALGNVTTQNITITDNDSVVDLSKYVRIGRYDLPEPTRTAAPGNSLLAKEASAVTYNWDTDTLFVVGDGGTSIVQVTKTGQLINSMTLAPGSSPQGTEFYDTEGLTYFGNGKFVLIEERYRQANLFTYVAGGTLQRSDVQTVKLGTTVGNIGIEGISYDPLTSGFIAVKELNPEGIFQTGIDFNAGTATNGSPTTDNSTNLFNPALANLADLSDVFALSNLPALSGTPDYNNLLILSQESGKIVNIDRSGNIQSSLTIIGDPDNPLSVTDQTNEGLTMDRNGILYVVNENGGGDANHPQLWVYAPSSVPNQAPTAIALKNQVNAIAENTSTTTRIKVADIAITDDGLGSNNLTVTGSDANFFEVDSTGLYIKAGTVLDYETKTSYSININVDDPTVGSNPDATTPYTLNVTDVVNEGSASTSLKITEVAPWSSGNSTLAADWFEVTNTGSSAVNITGWKMDDNSNSFGSAVALNGITNIAAGESVIFIESSDPAVIQNFKALWFGANAPANLQIGTYSGSGVGLSTSGDAVNLFDGGGTLQANVTFGASPGSAPFSTFDNSAGLNNVAILQLSTIGQHGAFVAVDNINEIGSPATIAAPSPAYAVFNFSIGNYSVTEGNTPGFSTNATVRIYRTGDVSGTNSVQLKLSDGTATGSGLSVPVQSTLQGTSTGSTPYILPVASGVKVISLLTTDNTGAKPDDTVPKVSGGTYGMDGIPDGLGAFDNGDGTFTVLMNHELGNTNGVVRDHGARGAYVSKFVIDKSTLQVVSGEDLIKQIYGWNSTTQSVNTTAPITLAINRFCSADLPAVTAFYNPNTGLGSQARIFMNGEEGGTTGYQFATVVTGADAGKAYVLGKFNLSTNGSGLSGVGGWENALANPYAQDKTIVIGNNDGGTGIMNNAVAVYVGTKQSTGTEVDKAGLTNGILKFISVAGNSAEIANATTRATNITNGTRFILSSTASTTFSRPEDGAWNPLDPRQYFFATTDRLDQVSDGVGTQIGQTRLWRLTFDDITNPDAGGTIDLLIDGDTVNGVKVNMFDNISIDKYGHILLQEDVGGAAHNGKIWQYDIATDTLKQIAKHDPARFGDIGVAATSPFNNDEESSGIIDVQDILGPGWFLTSDQAHYTTGVTTSQVEGGQLLAIFNPDTYNAAIDYNNTPITVTFNPGETYKDVQIPIAGDFTPEANETVNLSLVNPSAGTVIGTKQPNAVLTINNDDLPPSARIHDIQGAGHISPLNGQNVTNVPGIVTAIASNGFYLQDPIPDNDDRTSEGIFVFTSSAPTVAVGDYIQVSGKVSEFRPGGSANNLTITEITSSTINKLSSGNTLPAATILGNGGRTIPTIVIENDATNVESSGVFDPANDGIDFYESLEGMRVQINNPVTTSPTNFFGSSEEIWVLADNGANATSRTARGGSLITSTDFNPERIQIDDLINSALTLPTVNVGARLSTITGVVNYDFNNYEVLVSTEPTVVQASSLQKEVTNLTSTDPNKLTVATFNVENLDPGDDASKFNALASAIANNLKSPDIISLEEIQDNNGPTNDSVVDASVTYQKLINAIASAGGPTYQYRQIDPVDDTNGGEPGGNIRVGFLFNPNRVSFVDRPGGTSTSNTTVSNAGGTATLSASPGLVDPTNSAFNSSRKPLVGEFTFNGQTVYVIGNHFNSKGGDQPLYGPNQPPTLSSEVQRQQQATIVKNFVQSILAINPNANVVVAGDLNDFEFSNPLNTLKSAGLSALIETLPANERYTYNFEGNAQTLDHILVSGNLFNKLDGYDVVHINSEFADQVSDHDPSVARFSLLPNQAPTAVNLNNPLTSINENSDISSRVKVAEIAIADDGLGKNNLSLSGTDASFFEIDNSILYLKAGTSLDYESKSSYNVTVTVDDPTVGNTPDATANFTLTVNDFNEAPTAVTLNNSTTSLAENSNTTSRIELAEIAIADDALGTNNLSLSGTDAGFFEIDNSVLYLKAGTNLDYESKSSYKITVAVDDPTVGNNPDATANFTLTVNDVNEAPIAKNDSATTTDIKPVTINVLANDSDPDSDPLSISSFTNPNGGTVVKNQDNTFTYTPDIGFSGSDSFAYTASDGKGGTGTATVNLTINRVSTGIFGTLNQDNLTGTNQNDLIGGLAGDDVLKGGNGDDTIYGGLGNDSLGGENGNDILYGDSGNDTLLGGNGDDVLVGGKGSDFLTGGNGSDRFYLTGNSTGEFDTITDFVHGVDSIVVSKSEFGLSQLPGVLNSSLFWSGISANTSSNRFIYNSSTGNLFFDADGTGSTTQIQIAQLTNRAILTSSDITVIA
ncbi:MAG: SdiA-regulated domain-containing protein [Aulosira sp. ZfuVER01]|nr:SdiA-regulated domain-containing protein [Aulosira sp. ZfuVER01]MDZ7997459.1 SdiA-regulated domain-containing protein [Aulosira sp. DedVER01a]MDZ8054512.1 SdiA-regulated domain-containing protein [Aulosira sp. ZfuCHP01]